MHLEWLGITYFRIVCKKVSDAVYGRGAILFLYFILRCIALFHWSDICDCLIVANKESEGGIAPSAKLSNQRIRVTAAAAAAVAERESEKNRRKMLSQVIYFL